MLHIIIIHYDNNLHLLQIKHSLVTRVYQSGLLGDSHFGLLNACPRASILNKPSHKPALKRRTCSYMYAEDAFFWINHLQLIELKKEYTKTGLLLSENIWALSLLLQRKADACGCYKNLVPVRNQNYKIVIQTILATVHHLSPLNVSLLLNLGAFFLLP